MGHLPLHDIGRTAADPTRNTDELLLDRLTPGLAFMSYVPLEEVVRHYLEGQITLEQAVRWIEIDKHRDWVKRNYIEILRLIAEWSNGRVGHFFPLKNRLLTFGPSQFCPVHVTGLWVRPNDSMMVWFFLRKVEALLGTNEFGFTVSGMRNVFTDVELRSVPITVVDLSAGAKNAPRRLMEYRDADLPDWSTSDMDEVFQRYLDARVRIEPALRARRQLRKKKGSGDQGELF